MKKFLLCLAMLFMFSTIVQAAETKPSSYQKLNVVQKMRMPINVTTKEKLILAERISGNSDRTNSSTKSKTLPNVAVLYINNSKSTYNDEVDMSVLPNLGHSLPADKYNLVDGAVYLEKLNKIGITDLSTAERADILVAFRDDNIDYVIIMEIQPFVAREKMTLFTVGKDLTTSVPFKIVDVVNGSYLYNGKFTEKASESSMIGPLGNKSMSLKALNTVNMQVASIIGTRLPQTKPVLLSVKPSK